jgi:hypothetical protein
MAAGADNNIAIGKNLDFQSGASYTTAIGFPAGANITAGYSILLLPRKTDGGGVGINITGTPAGDLEVNNTITLTPATDADIPTDPVDGMMFYYESGGGAFCGYSAGGWHVMAGDGSCP